MNAASFNEEIKYELGKIYSLIKENKMDNSWKHSLLLLMYYMRFLPEESMQMLKPISQCLEAGINPAMVANAFVKYQELYSDFEKKANDILRGKKRQGRRKKVLRLKQTNKPYRDVYYEYQDELAKKKAKMKYKTLHSLLSEKFKKELKKNPARLDSIKVQYYRVRKRIEQNFQEKQCENEVIDTIISYLFKHSFVTKAKDQKTGEENLLLGSFELGNSRSIYDSAINEEKYNEQMLKSLQKKFSRANGEKN